MSRAPKTSIPRQPRLRDLVHVNAAGLLRPGLSSTRNRSRCSSSTASSSISSSCARQPPESRSSRDIGPGWLPLARKFASGGACWVILFVDLPTGRDLVGRLTLHMAHVLDRVYHCASPDGRLAQRTSVRALRWSMMSEDSPGRDRMRRPRGAGSIPLCACATARHRSRTAPFQTMRNSSSEALVPRG